MKRVKQSFRLIYRFIVLWLVDVISLWLTSLLVPGITIAAVNGTPGVVIAASAALLLGLVNLVVRPLILLLALPLGFSALFAVGFVINAITLTITAALLPGFSVSGVFAAFFGGLLLSAINTLIVSIMTIDDDDQFYQGLVERIAARQSFKHTPQAGRGLVILEIDGLSYWHMRKAIDEGLLPTLTEMIEAEGYQLSRVDCGLPSQTSACQAGILFGENYDIPAFRWYDKEESRLIVSGRDASEINERYANGKGLLRGGSSINNMLNGDAEKSMLTLSNLSSGSPEERRRRAQDMYLLLLNPYFFMRTLVLFVGDILIELFQGVRQRLRNEWPRLNRLANFYPVLRASTTVFLRDVASYLVVLDIIRGSPTIYMTWSGYDEVAHHSGPWSRDAFDILRRFDATIARVSDIIQRKAPIPYELILLSDHGQSFGATFQQRYGQSLEALIEQQLPEGTQVTLTSGGDDGTLSVRAMRAELENIQEYEVGGRVGQEVMRQTEKVISKGTAQREAEDLRETSGVIVCGSGNLAQVYFDLLPRRLSLPELQAAYPGMVEALVSHEGIGFVVGYLDSYTPVVLGKGGYRNLHTGEVSGEDPLEAFGSPTLRAAQVRRVAEFPHTGDLMVNSTLYPDGTVAAMEELIGNHGGIGGEQTDAFVFHPPDLEVPPTRDATDIYDILKKRRTAPPKVMIDTDPEPSLRVNEWSATTLRLGLERFETWLSLAAHTLWLDGNAYQAAVRDPYMTAPALLIVLLTSFFAAALNPMENFFFELFGRLLIWPVLVLVLFAAGRLLGGRGTYTQTLRAMGFGQIGNLFLLLQLFPPLETLSGYAAFAMVFIGTWIGIDKAHQLSGWRTWVLPLAALLVLIGGVAVLGLFIGGAAYTVETLLGDLLQLP